MDGSETYKRYAEISSTVLYQCEKAYALGNSTIIKSTHFNYVASIWNETIIGAAMGGGDNISDRPEFRVDKTLYPTPEIFQQWVLNQYTSGTPLVILYSLNENVVIDLDDNLQEVLNSLFAIEGSTKITTTNSVNPSSLTLNYPQNLKAYIQSIVFGG